MCCQVFQPHGLISLTHKQSVAADFFAPPPPPVHEPGPRQSFFLWKRRIVCPHTFQPFHYYAYSVLLIPFGKKKEKKRCTPNESFSLRRRKHIEIIFIVKDTIWIKFNKLTIIGLILCLPTFFRLALNCSHLLMRWFNSLFFLICYSLTSYLHSHIPFLTFCLHSPVPTVNLWRSG